MESNLPIAEKVLWKNMHSAILDFTSTLFTCEQAVAEIYVTSSQQRFCCQQLMCTGALFVYRPFVTIRASCLLLARQSCNIGIRIGVDSAKCHRAKTLPHPDVQVEIDNFTTMVQNKLILLACIGNSLLQSATL